MTLLAVLSFVVLLAATYHLGRTVFGPLAGAIAAALLLTRLNFGFYAAFAFVDMPFAALVMTAAALEAARPRRGGVVWVLLVAAGLLRPEGWVFAAAYGLWLWRAADAGARARIVAWVALAPLLWALSDLVATGDPLFSWTYTTGEAEKLGRQRTWDETPQALWSALAELLKPPLAIVGAAGVALVLARRRWREAQIPLALLALGVATFGLVVLGGVSGQVPRYAAIAGVALLLFAGHLVSELLLPRAGARAARGADRRRGAHPRRRGVHGLAATSEERHEPHGLSPRRRGRPRRGAPRRRRPGGAPLRPRRGAHAQARAGRALAARRARGRRRRAQRPRRGELRSARRRPARAHEAAHPRRGLRAVRPAGRRQLAGVRAAAAGRLRAPRPHAVLRDLHALLTRPSRRGGDELGLEQIGQLVDLGQRLGIGVAAEEEIAAVAGHADRERVALRDRDDRVDLLERAAQQEQRPARRRRLRDGEVELARRRERAHERRAQDRRHEARRPATNACVASGRSVCFRRAVSSRTHARRCARLARWIGSGE